MTTTAPPATAVRRSAPTDAAAVSSALAAAFEDDPVFVWLLPDEHRRREGTRALFDGLVDTLAVHDETWTTTAGVTGAALWVPYGRPPMSDEQAERFVEELAALCGPHAARAVALVTAMDEQHPPIPHEYLWFVGVVPAAQGRGIGATLLAPVLERADREGRPSYLEATSERSKALYQRLGFRTGTPFAAPGGPPLWPMWRDPADSASAAPRQDPTAGFGS